MLEYLQKKFKETEVYANFFKRLIDFILSACAIIVLGIPLLIVALLIKVKLGSPVLFKQRRPGKNGKIFEIYKFRTMTDERDANGNLLPDNERLTDFGKLLRSTSIDELPEILNIVKGDMAIIGPRPLLEEYLPLYNEEQAHRHDVRPGLTGWAQINGRNTISWEDKFKYDVEYVRNISFMFDLKVFFLTIKKVFVREGINASAEVTMDKFRGSK